MYTIIVIIIESHIVIIVIMMAIIVVNDKFFCVCISEVELEFVHMAVSWQ